MSIDMYTTGVGTVGGSIGGTSERGSRPISTQKRRSLSAKKAIPDLRFLCSGRSCAMAAVPWRRASCPKVILHAAIRASQSTRGCLAQGDLWIFWTMESRRPPQRHECQNDLFRRLPIYVFDRGNERGGQDKCARLASDMSHFLALAVHTLRTRGTIAKVAFTPPPPEKERTLVVGSTKPICEYTTRSNSRERSTSQVAWLLRRSKRGDLP
jgi:hypothetical protein